MLDYRALCLEFVENPPFGSANKVNALYHMTRMEAEFKKQEKTKSFEQGDERWINLWEAYKLAVYEFPKWMIGCNQLAVRLHPIRLEIIGRTQ